MTEETISDLINYIDLEDNARSKAYVIVLNFVYLGWGVGGGCKVH